MTQYQKILVLMCRDTSRWFSVFDFMKNGLGDLYVGYKASSRLPELANEYPKLFLEKPNGKYVQRRINVDEIELWFDGLNKDLRQVVAKELGYYPQVDAYEKSDSNQ